MLVSAAVLHGSRISRRVAAILAPLVWACAAGNAPAPAAAQPRASAAPPAHRASARGVGRRSSPIGEENVSRLQRRWEVAAGGFGRAVAVSHKQRTVAYSAGALIRLYDVRSGKPVGTIRTCDDLIRGGMSFEQGKLFVVCESGVRIYEGTKPSTQKLPIHTSRVTAAAYAWPNLALGHHDGVVRIYGLDGSATVEVPVPGPPIDVKSLALTRDGTRLAVAWIQGSIWWWDTRQPGTPHKLVRNDNESDSVAFNQDGSLFAEEGRTNFTTIWRFTSEPALRHAELKNGDWVKRILFTRDSKWLVRGGSDGLEAAEIAGPRRVLLDARSNVEDVAMDEDGATVAAADRDGRLTYFALR